ncbi:hypothetical protein B0I35DRAFT_133817 [Stachybotrys elegans]|uniref:Uncharacterized protein n=1 Tax=Stachybotrys elegans TaxID=80388 RepID=A0A8K0SZN5_9HYPO|nr:hypothetical protein B0I35DRAFT_133817 [Stachybotrys elegans]
MPLPSSFLISTPPAMNPSFTGAEKRFVLAEMIKASSVDIDSLVFFIKSQGIEPDWMSMQLPLGRNMNQCVQVAERFGIRSSSSSLKRRLSDSPHDYPAKRMSFSDSLDQPRPSPTKMSHPGPTTASSHVPILPRPPNGFHQGPPPPPPAAPVAPRKRGRPSRADKAKRDLRPILPQQPVPLAPASSTHHGQQSASANTGRPILPAVNTIQRPRALTPPVAYSASRGQGEELRHAKLERPTSADSARPRILAEAGFEGFERTSPLRPLYLAGPSDTRSRPTLTASLDSPSPQLPPLSRQPVSLLKMESPLASIVTSARQAEPAAVTNSA